MDDIIIKKKIFISTVGWVCSIFSGLIIYFSIWGIIDLIIINQNNPIFISDSIDRDSEFYKSFFNINIIILTIYFISILFSLFFLVGSIGIIKFKNWGRILFITISWIIILITVPSLGFYIVYSGKVLNAITNNSDSFNDINGFMKSMLSIKIVTYGILLIVIIRTLFRLSIKFKNNSYKTLFN